MHRRKHRGRDASGFTEPDLTLAISMLMRDHANACISRGPSRVWTQPLIAPLLPPSLSLSLHQLQRCLVPWKTECARKGHSSFRWNDSFNEPILASNVPPRWKPILFSHKFKGTVSNCTITRSYRPREKLTGRHAHTIPSPLFFRGELDHGCCCSLTGNGIPTGEIIFVPYPRSFDGGSPRYVIHTALACFFRSRMDARLDYCLLQITNIRCNN